jgi:hypothetical protein
MSRVVNGLYPEQQQADRLGVKLRTLRAWRAKGYGPTPTYIGRFPYYSPENEAKFKAASERPFPQTGRAAR